MKTKILIFIILLFYSFILHKKTQIKISLNKQKLIEKYGPWALVTGGAQGIGLAIATSLAKRGMNIILVDIKGDLAQKEADQLEIRHGIKTKVVELDLSREDADAVLFKKLADFWNDQKIGTVILNHAVSKRSTFFNVAPEDINPKFQANAGSYTRLSLAFAKHMSTRFMNRLLGNENARASIVFMSSASGNDKMFDKYNNFYFSLTIMGS